MRFICKDLHFTVSQMNECLSGDFKLKSVRGNVILFAKTKSATYQHWKFGKGRSGTAEPAITEGRRLREDELARATRP